VIDNFYDGCSVSNGPANRVCGDGLVFGASINYVVTGNRIINFSYEGIYINPWVYGSSVPVSQQVATVTGNYLDGGKGKVNENYGVRTDYHNTVVSNNVMKNISAKGVIVTKEPNTPQTLSGVQVLDNDITMVANTNLNPMGILLNAHSSRIQGNTIRVPAPTGGTAYGIVAGGCGYHCDGITNYLVADLTLEDNVVQMKSTGDGSISYTSVGIEIWNLTTPFSVAGNLVMDADQGLHLKEQLPPVTRADYEAGNQFLRCIKNVE